MAAWITLTPTDLDAASVAGKVARIRAIATAKALPDPAVAAIQRITDELRGLIGFSGKYQLDATPTSIPPSFRDIAALKIVRECSKSVSLPLTADEQADERTYEARLDKIRLGQWPVETPDNPIPAPQISTGPAVLLVGAQCRRFTRDQMRGL